MSARSTAAKTALALLTVLGSPAFAIINGEIDADELFPQVGAIVVVKPVPLPEFPAFADPPAVVCSGVLIHPRVMLTAGHCTADIPALGVIDDIRVSFGVDSFDPKTWIEVDAVFTHPGYNPSSLANDIGVVVLRKPVKGVMPALLPSAFLLDDLNDSGLLGEELAIAGYGRNLPGVDADGLRRFGFGPLKSLKKDVLILKRDDEAGITSTALHDSGSPAYWIDPASGTLVIAGILSDASGPHQRVYIRADQPQTLLFLATVIGAVENGDL